jgi:hypothetical protein
MEAACCFETSVSSFKTTRCDNQEDSNLNSHWHEKLSYFSSEDEGSMFLRNFDPPTGLHGVKTQKITIWIITAVKTWKHVDIPISESVPQPTQFIPEDRSSIVLRYVHIRLQDYTISQHHNLNNHSIEILKININVLIYYLEVRDIHQNAIGRENNLTSSNFNK